MLNETNMIFDCQNTFEYKNNENSEIVTERNLNLDNQS